MIKIEKIVGEAQKKKRSSYMLKMIVLT